MPRSGCSNWSPRRRRPPPPPDRPAAEVHRLPLRDPAPAGLAPARVSAALAPPSGGGPKPSRSPRPQAAPDEVPAEQRRPEPADLTPWHRPTRDDPAEPPAAAAPRLPPTAEPANRRTTGRSRQPDTDIRPPRRPRRTLAPSGAARPRWPRVALLLLALLVRTDGAALPRPRGRRLARHPALAAGGLQPAGLPHRGAAPHRQPQRRQQRPGAPAGQPAVPAVAGGAEQGGDRRCACRPSTWH